jgi:PAS domain S-box-containing protein
MTPEAARGGSFARYVEFLPEAVLLVDGSGAVVDANRAATQLLRRPREHLVGSTLAALACDDMDSVARLIRAGSRTREPVLGALRFRADGATALDIRCEALMLEPRAGATPALLALRLFERHRSVNQFLLLNQRIDELGREVSRRRAAEAQLQSYGERLRVTLASIGDAVIATDHLGAVVLMNGVAQELTGWGEDEARGRALAEVFVIVEERSRRPVESPVDKVLREGKVVGLANHTLLISRHGRECAIDDSGAPIRDIDGALVGVVLVFRDFTERHALERQLQEQTARLVESAQRKDEFMSMLAHELRNPLAPMMTGLQVLRRIAPGLADVDRVTSMMERQLKHMTRLVDDLLDVARLTQGKIELRRQPVELGGVLQQAVDMVRPLAEARHQRLELDAAAQRMRIDADTTRLVQVFANLLSNGVKFSPEGGRIVVHAGTAPHGRTVQVRVTDNGIGIEAEMLTQVFELFVQADRSLDRAQGGLGIGLTVVRTIVDMHGGNVALRSPGPGQGTEVVVELPLLDPEPVAPRSVGAPGAVTAAPQGSAATPSLRVLVVDDNLDAGEMLLELLQLWGHDASASGDGPTALEIASRWLPQAVLLDIGLPGMSGHEVARRLRELLQPPLLLVAVTGYGAPDDQLASRDAGFDVHLTKPVDLDELQALLTRHAAVAVPGFVGHSRV